MRCYAVFAWPSPFEYDSPRTFGAYYLFSDGHIEKHYNIPKNKHKDEEIVEDKTILGEFLDEPELIVNEQITPAHFEALKSALNLAKVILSQQNNSSKIQ